MTGARNVKNDTTLMWCTCAPLQRVFTTEERPDCRRRARGRGWCMLGYVGELTVPAIFLLTLGFFFL